MRTKLRVLLVLVALAVVMRPAVAQACSCRPGPNDCGEALTQARDKSSRIFLGRVLGIEKRPGGTTASIEVIEPFKGSLPIGTMLHVPAGGHGDCTFHFKAGKTYLVYEMGDWCSRTREVTSAAEDVELKWLRTGVLPPAPRALLRESVQCEPCSVETVTAALFGPGHRTAFRKEEVVPAFEAGGPFWAAGFYDLDDDRRQLALGRTSDGGTFELVQTPFFGTREFCRQRVVKRSCERLEPRSDNSLAEPPLRCVHPGPEVEVCNEERSRASNWGRLEELSAASCNWRDPAVGRCTLSETPSPLRERGATRSAVLRCSPEFDTPRINACVVVVEGTDGGR